ncbi:MAG: hypothetical protein ACLGPL_00740 [Acidobacteriota bacterium]
MEQCDTLKLSLICLTTLLSIAILAYTFYISYVIRNTTNVNIGHMTPSKNTFKIGFLAIIIIALAYLTFAFGEKLNSGVLALIGTLSGYVLGSSKEAERKNDINHSKGTSSDSSTPQ